MFADYARIRIRSGKGGDGHVSFRREKFVPAGGPDGGDGGRGGDVVLEVDPSMNTLFFYKHRYQFKAEPGADGGKKRCHGKDGADIVLKVPEGTILREEHSGKIIADMSGSNLRQVVLKGGSGGRGNMNFATPTNQAPQYAEPGKPAMELECTLELKLVADVGLVGFPNAGKSTFLSRVTNADPKIADYPFTTINPNLGVVDLGDGRGFVIADMPGLIEGASEGVGLGFRFLRHIERTRVLIHLVDTASFDGRDPVEDIRQIHAELAKFNPDIMKKPIVIAPNKIDAVQYDAAWYGVRDDTAGDGGETQADAGGTQAGAAGEAGGTRVDAAGNQADAAGDGAADPVQRIRAEFEPQGYPVFPISAVTGQGIKELLFEVRKLLDTKAPETVYYKQEYFPEDLAANSDLPYTIETEIGRKGETVYVVEGPKIEKMLSYTNLDSEKGFLYFQQFLRRAGISDALREAGIEEGGTVRMYGHVFEFFDEEADIDESDE